jgi:hypoxanthine-DNA glycosylase
MTAHPIPPVCGSDPRVLILGSFPSVKSREIGFFYGHPQNRFWRVMAAVLDEPLPETVEQKVQMLTSHGIALWDVIASCNIQGSSDSTITDVIPTDLSPIVGQGTLRAVCTNGAVATKLYRRYQQSSVGISAIQLPSTSPANAAKSLNQLVDEWKIIRRWLT